MKNYTLVIFLCCIVQIGLVGQAHWENIITQKVPENLKMSAALYQIGSMAAHDQAIGKTKANQMEMIFNNNENKIKIEIVKGWETSESIDRNELDKLPVDVHLTWKNRASCWVALKDIIPAAAQLPDDYLMLSVHKKPNDNEGQGLQNSQSYIDNGKDGTGIKVAIIDSGFDSLGAYQSTNDVPPIIIQNDWTGNGIGGGIHGTACLEVVYDNAPGATFYVHKVSNPTETGAAVDQAIQDGVRIISHSQSEYNLGWDDNSGAACDAVSDATDAGILFFTSAGNRNGEHWQGFFNGGGNDWHNWSGADETNSFTVGQGGVVRLRMQWNGSPDPIADDYDLFLYNANTGNILASSQSAFTYEEIIWTNPLPSLPVYFRVKQDGTDNNEFEVFNHPTCNNCTVTDFQHNSNAGSTTSPSNSTKANCLSIGAVPKGNYTQTAGSNVIAGYSSLGPTNSGNQAPNLSAVTNSTTRSYNGDFGGTSCSTPNAAGAAAAFWSAHTHYSATGVRQILNRKASLFNDWGPGGTDMTYGHGGLFLKDYSPNTRYIYKFSGNTNGSSSLPYASFQQANQYAPTGYTLYGLAHTHLAPSGGIVLTKPMVYKSTEKSTVVE